MPRYFFHLLHPDCDPVRDDEGLILEDDVTAKREGIVSLGELVAEVSASQAMPFSVSVQIVRNGGEVIELLTGQLGIEPQP